MKKLSKLYFEKRTLEKPPNSNSSTTNNMALICLPVVSQARRGPISRRSASGRQLHQAYNEFGEPGTETWTFQLFLAARGESNVSIFKISQPKTVDDIFWYAGPFHPHVSPTDTSWKPQGHNKWELEPPTKNTVCQRKFVNS